MTVLSPDFDALCLDFNPWGYDETDVTQLSNRMVVTRVQSECAICFGPIGPGQRVRAVVERNNECMRPKVMTFRFCIDCCVAMVKVARHQTIRDELALERRYALGQKRAIRKEGR